MQGNHPPAAAWAPGRGCRGCLGPSLEQSSAGKRSLQHPAGRAENKRMYSAQPAELRAKANTAVPGPERAVPAAPAAPLSDLEILGVDPKVGLAPFVSLQLPALLDFGFSVFSARGSTGTTDPEGLGSAP